jgi:carboxyl-terminal processing protease
MQKKLVFLTVVLVAVIGFGFVLVDNVYLKVNRNIDIFGRVYKEIVNNYVDEVDPEKFIHAGIDGMLETLDPYTVFIGEKEGEEIDLITHGQYGGVGISIGLRDGNITVIAPMEGYSAQKQGIRAGDIFIAIDGISVLGANLDSVRSRVRGEPGTTVKMTVQREGEKKPLEFVLVREEIQVNNVSYAGMLRNGVGYIKLDRFSRRAGDEVRQAIKDLKTKGTLYGLILDLRDNPGGLLEAAVDIVSNFVPQGSVIVTTRGRNSADEKTYISKTEPVALDIPLAVLINRGSASASEIVAGAIQDLDRGIILGNRSFGKGLVQTISPLGYNASLKITTARYYTPSGRSIQEIDYKRKNKDGIFATIPDSLRKRYTTLHGRGVLDAGGVTPDSMIHDSEPSSYDLELLRKSTFFKFATTYVAKHPSGKDFTVSDTVMKEFEQFLNGQKFEFKDDAERKLTEVKDFLLKEKYSPKVLTMIDAAQAMIEKEKASAFSRHSEEIKHELEQEIVARYEGERGRIRVSLAHDKQIDNGIDLMTKKEGYAILLQSSRGK